MALNMEKEVDAMERMTTDQLRQKYAEDFGEPTNARHKTWLIKRIAWRMQSNAEGGLSERALKRAAEIVNESDIRMSPPRANSSTADQQKRTKVVSARIEANSELLPGVVLQRDHKGRQIQVKVLDDGFEYLGERYKSLTAIADAVTGKHWNGYHFFNVGKKGGK